MINYTFGKFALAIVILLALGTAGRAQIAPTPEQLEFVTVLGNRIRSMSQAEVATLRTQLQPAITAELQTERIRIDLVGQGSRLAARIECLSGLVREYARIRGNIDQNAAQQVNSWRSELSQLNLQLANVNARLNVVTAALNDARERRLAAERIVASKEGKNLQQFSDLTYLYNMWRLNPPRYTWEAMIERLTEVAREKQLASNVTVSAGAAPVTVRCQLASGGQIYSRDRCTQCVIRLPVGHYNFWVETGGAAEPKRTAYLIFRESHSIQISQPIPSTH